MEQTILFIIQVFGLFISWAAAAWLVDTFSKYWSKPKETPSDTLDKMIHDYWGLREEILYSKTRAELVALELEVDHFGSCYTNMIPGDMLAERMESLKEAIENKISKLNKPKTYDSI